MASLLKPRLTDIYNSFLPGLMSTTTPAVRTQTPFAPVTRTLPGTGETYQSEVVAPVTATAAPATVPVRSASTLPPARTAASTPQTSTGLDYSRYMNPATGIPYTPQEYADLMARRVTGGSIPGYAGDVLTQGPQTTAQLTSTATDLNNQRNDIATGTTDPYKIGTKSGIAYSPSELRAIESAYAGIYDPALKDVFAKLDAKEKQDAADRAQKDKLDQMAKQHQYDLELKRTPTPAQAGSTSISGTYTPGANPVVDAWAERIANGSAKITEIPASDKGMRNAVTLALQTFGNQPDGRPTTTEIGKQTLDVAERLLTMFDKGQGISTVGTSRLFGGGFNAPGSASSDFQNLFDTLSANKSLEGVKFLKGQGSVSDAERQLLKQAMSELNQNQSEPAFRKSLVAIINKLKGGAGVLRSPDGTQEVDVASLTPAELKEAQDAGWR